MKAYIIKLIWMLKHVLKTKTKTHLQGRWWFVFICGQLSQHSALTTQFKHYMPRINSVFVGVWLATVLRIFNRFYCLSAAWLHSGFFVYSSCLQTGLGFALAHLTYPWKLLWKRSALKQWKCNMCQVTSLLPWLSCPDLWGPCRNHCRSFRTFSSALWWDPGSPNPPVSDLSWACHSLQRRHTKSHKLINQPER